MAPLTPTQSLCSLDSHFDPFLEDDSELFLVSLQTKRKRVRIDTRAVRFDYVEHVSELTAEDRRQGWWSKDEYEATKLDAKNECRELRRSGIFKGCLTDAYEHACNIADNASGGCDDFKSKETTEHLAPPTSLLEWCNGNESSRGLERWSSKVHGFLRGNRVGQAKHAVLMEQARQFLVNQQDSDAIANVSAKASRRSRTFAMLLGAADAISVSCDRKRCRDDSAVQQARKMAKTAVRSSQNEPIILSDDESDEELNSSTYISFDALSNFL